MILVERKQMSRVLKINPNLWPTQSRFFLSKARYPGFFGGWGAGKSYVAVYKAIVLAMMNPGCAGIFAEPTYNLILKVALPLFKKILKDLGIPFHYHKTEKELTLLWWPETKIWFFSMDNPDYMEGPTVAWAVMDEACKCDKKHWEVIESRVREPEAQFQQVCAIGSPEEIKADWVQELWQDNPAPGYELHQASTWENRLIPRESLRSKKLTYDEDDYKRKVLGLFVKGGAGTVYKGFRRDIHVNSGVSIFDPARRRRVVPFLPICLCCDFNVDPCCWLLLQYDKSGRIYVFDEIVLRDTDTNAMTAEFIKRGYMNHKSGIVVYGDASGRSHRTSGDSDYLLMMKAGLGTLDIPKANPAIVDRVNAVNDRFRHQVDDRPSVQIHPSCTKFIKDLEEVKWKQTSQNKVLDPGADRQLTHMSDAFGYFIHRQFPITITTYTQKRSVAEIVRGRR